MVYAILNENGFEITSGVEANLVDKMAWELATARQETVEIIPVSECGNDSYQGKEVCPTDVEALAVDALQNEGISSFFGSQDITVIDATKKLAEWLQENTGRWEAATGDSGWVYNGPAEII